jgi:sulfur carrier protein
MKILLNNNPVDTRAADLAALMAEQGIDTQGTAVAVGTDVIPRGHWAETPLAEGCTVTVIRATRGG